MNKKAFTLVELLAVIVLLSVAALIATPMIIKVMNEAEKKAFKESVNGMIRTVNNDSDKQGYVSMTYSVTNGSIYDSNNNKIHIGGGDKEFGSLRINDDGEIILAVHNDKWCATKKYDENFITLKDYVENSCKMPVSEVVLPTYSVNPPGDVWAKSKTATITYPERKSEFIYQYSLNNGNTWETLASGITKTVNFTSNGNLIARIYDGINYHTASSLSVTKIDSKSPTAVSVSKVSSTSSSITVKANGVDGESGIGKYEFSKDNGNSWVSGGTNSTYTFTGLKTGNYQVKVRVTDKVGNSTISSAIAITTGTIQVPIYSVNPSGDVWANSKTVTITYPARQNGFVYQYSLNGGSTWETLSSGTTKELTFNYDGSVIARIYDGTNYHTASSLSVTKIDTLPPERVSAVAVDRDDSINVEAVGMDSQSGIAMYEFSKDDGMTWVNNGNNKMYTFYNLAPNTYQIRVRLTDNAGNQTVSYPKPVTIQKKKTQDFTIIGGPDIHISKYYGTGSVGVSVYPDYGYNREVEFSMNNGVAMIDGGSPVIASQVSITCFRGYPGSDTLYIKTIDGSNITKTVNVYCD